MLMVFLSSGLFLGWSLGANDAANVFGTAVGSKMVRFKTAAIIASVFVVLGAVIGGAGASHTLGKLGAVNAIAGSFMVAFAAGFTVFWMTKLHLPVSTSQAIVGAIIGWNFFSNSLTDFDSLTKILLTWVLCPLLAASIAAAIFSVFRAYINRIPIHILSVDSHTRTGLLLVGAFGAYSLGANNIANVMGVFVPVTPFDRIGMGWVSFSSAQILFFIGSIAIAIGIITYSKKVMDTVGSSLMKISPIAAFVVVLAQAIVLFIFSSEGLENWLVGNGLPAIPLVPVSSSQAVVGAVIGIGLVKGGKGINYGVLGEIATGWVTTPVIACVISFVALFFLQNVFNQKVHQDMTYKINDQVVRYLDDQTIPVENVKQLKNIIFENPIDFQNALKEKTKLNDDQIEKTINSANVQKFIVDQKIIESKLDFDWLGKDRVSAIKLLIGNQYDYKFQLIQDLAFHSTAWKLKENTIANKLYNKEIKEKSDYIANKFKINNEIK